jgi:hypothetical protein
MGPSSAAPVLGRLARELFLPQYFRPRYCLLRFSWAISAVRFSGTAANSEKQNPARKFGRCNHAENYDVGAAEAVAPVILGRIEKNPERARLGSSHKFFQLTAAPSFCNRFGALFSAGVT